PERVEVIVELHSRVSPLNTYHQARRVPVTRFPGKLVSGNFRYPESNQCWRVHHCGMGVLISAGELDVTAEPECAVELSADRTIATQVLALASDQRWSLADCGVGDRINNVCPKHGRTGFQPAPE